MRLSELISGGPPKDGIPAIDRPNFISIAEAGKWLGGNEPVIALEVEGEVRAYPLQILIWHEIVNDEIGGGAKGLVAGTIGGLVASWVMEEFQAF